MPTPGCPPLLRPAHPTPGPHLAVARHEHVAWDADCLRAAFQRSLEPAHLVDLKQWGVQPGRVRACVRVRFGWFGWGKGSLFALRVLQRPVTDATRLNRQAQTCKCPPQSRHNSVESGLVIPLPRSVAGRSHRPCDQAGTLQFSRGLAIRQGPCNQAGTLQLGRDLATRKGPCNQAGTLRLGRDKAERHKRLSDTPCTQDFLDRSHRCCQILFDSSIY
eukprot:363964-Chlamydomonas_euryale.AAC.2